MGAVNNEQTLLIILQSSGLSLPRTFPLLVDAPGHVSGPQRRSSLCRNPLDQEVPHKGSLSQSTGPVLVCSSACRSVHGLSQVLLAPTQVLTQVPHHPGSSGWTGSAPCNTNMFINHHQQQNHHPHQHHQNNDHKNPTCFTYHRSFF